MGTNKLYGNIELVYNIVKYGNIVFYVRLLKLTRLIIINEHILGLIVRNNLLLIQLVL